MKYTAAEKVGSDHERVVEKTRQNGSQTYSSDTKGGGLAQLTSHQLPQTQAGDLTSPQAAPRSFRHISHISFLLLFNIA